jgi:hypothetical protein
MSRIMYRSAEHGVFYTLHHTWAKRLTFDRTQANYRLLTFHAFRGMDAIGSTTESSRVSTLNISETHVTETCILSIKTFKIKILDTYVGLHARLTSMKEGLIDYDTDGVPL